MRIAAVAAALLLLVAATHRDPAIPREFQRANPCPVTGQTAGACPEWVRDHIIALCKGGPDAATNMQWQTIAAAKEKDRTECR